MRVHRSLQETALAKVLGLRDSLVAAERDVIKTTKKMDATAAADEENELRRRQASERAAEGIALFRGLRDEARCVRAAPFVSL